MICWGKRLDKKDKLQLSETDICDLFITPALKTSHWDPMTQIRREITLTPEHLMEAGISGKRERSSQLGLFAQGGRTGRPGSVGSESAGC
jgi:type I site-specific restriction endonuclease